MSRTEPEWSLEWTGTEWYPYYFLSDDLDSEGTGPTVEAALAALGQCRRTVTISPPDWCETHESHYYLDTPFCDRRLSLQSVVGHALKTMEKEKEKEKEKE